MDVVALDAAKLTALMVAGAAFALAGLWLMFKPQPAGEAAKIELFGLKFQASSAGLVVFLIGAVFLAMPIVVPEKPSDRAPEPPAGSPGEGEPAPELPLPRRAGAEELEGNDVISRVQRARPRPDRRGQARARRFRLVRRWRRSQTAGTSCE